jgi:hypothetical protein
VVIARPNDLHPASRGAFFFFARTQIDRNQEGPGPSRTLRTFLSLRRPRDPAALTFFDELVVLLTENDRPKN